MTDKQKKDLEALIAEKEQLIGCDIVILTINEPGLDSYDEIRDYAQTYYEDNKFGWNKANGDGIIYVDDWVQATIDAYFEQFKKRDEEMKALIGTVQNGKEWTEADYKQWRLNQIGCGERYQAMCDKVAQRATDANAVAVSYTNDATPGIYSLNRNYAAYTIEQVAGNIGFDLWDEQTVKRLMVEQPDLMPYYPKDRALKRGIDLAYGKKQITASVTSSILQGKSIKHMADDLQKRITTMSCDSAIRTARTAVTGAQNAGRMDSYAAAEKMGIKLKKEWLATLDSRTRHSHAMLDGEQVAQDKKFSNGCRFPGDPQGPPWEIYNCRCTLIAAVDGDRKSVV